jgi:hypothetical protein
MAKSARKCPKTVKELLRKAVRGDQTIYMTDRMQIREHPIKASRCAVPPEAPN